jgi:transcriptional regulator with XRE-family HTH domain
MRRRVEQYTVNALIAQLIYQTRTNAGLTQAQLARMAGTKQPVISQLEDADYAGHSLALLRRIAEALGKQLEIRFVDARRRKSA